MSAPWLDLSLTDEELAVAICHESPIDLGIVRALAILINAGVETYESCQGGEGHAYLEPAIRFHGGHDAGWHALAAAQTYRLPVWRRNEPSQHWKSSAALYRRLMRWAVRRLV